MVVSVHVYEQWLEREFLVYYRIVLYLHPPPYPKGSILYVYEYFQAFFKAFFCIFILFAVNISVCCEPRKADLLPPILVSLFTFWSRRRHAHTDGLAYVSIFFRVLFFQSVKGKFITLIGQEMMQHSYVICIEMNRYSKALNY